MIGNFISGNMTHRDLVNKPRVKGRAVTQVAGKVGEMELEERVGGRGDGRVE